MPSGNSAAHGTSRCLNLKFEFCNLQFALALLVVSWQSLVAQETVTGWHGNLDEARRVAEANGKPLFITFRCVR